MILKIFNHDYLSPLSEIKTDTWPLDLGNICDLNKGYTLSGRKKTQNELGWRLNRKWRSDFAYRELVSQEIYLFSVLNKENIFSQHII